MKLGTMLSQDLLKIFFFNFLDFESSIHSFKEDLKDKYKKENAIPWHLKTKVINYNMLMKLLVNFYL